jgi:hypothetical protein
MLTRFKSPALPTGFRAATTPGSSLIIFRNIVEIIAATRDRI